jgi:hypothetical protein
MIEFEGQLYCTVFEVAELLGLSTQQVRRRIHRGVFEAIEVQGGSNHWMYLITQESVVEAQRNNAALPMTMRRRPPGTSHRPSR